MRDDLRNDVSKREVNQPVYGRNLISAFTTTRKPRQICFPLHWHERIELICIKSGSLRLWANDTDEQLVSKNEVAIFCPQQIHGGIAGEDGVEFQVVAFELSSFFNNIPSALNIMKSIADAKVGFENRTSHPAVTGAFDRVMETAMDCPLQCVSQVYHLLGMLYQYCQPYEIKKNSRDEKLREMLMYINENYRQAVSTASLSEHFGYTPAYLCRYFKKNMGVPLMKYIEILRLEKAQKLLRQTSVPIGEIAMQCGFNDVCYFSFRFRKQCGISPTTYRQQKE